MLGTLVLLTSYFLLDLVLGQSFLACPNILASKRASLGVSSVLMTSFKCIWIVRQKSTYYDGEQLCSQLIASGTMWSSMNSMTEVNMVALKMRDTMAMPQAWSGFSDGRDQSAPHIFTASSTGSERYPSLNPKSNLCLPQSYNNNNGLFVNTTCHITSGSSKGCSIFRANNGAPFL